MGLKMKVVTVNKDGKLLVTNDRKMPILMERDDAIERFNGTVTIDYTAGGLYNLRDGMIISVKKEIEILQLLENHPNKAYTWSKSYPARQLAKLRGGVGLMSMLAGMYNPSYFDRRNVYTAGFVIKNEHGEVLTCGNNGRTRPIPSLEVTAQQDGDESLLSEYVESILGIRPELNCVLTKNIYYKQHTKKLDLFYNTIYTFTVCVHDVARMKKIGFTWQDPRDMKALIREPSNISNMGFAYVASHPYSD